MRLSLLASLLLCGACSFDSGGAGAIDGSPDRVELTEELGDRALVVRYFLDEASSGQTVTEAVDSADAPLALAVNYDPALSFATIDGNRGLRWTSLGGFGRASVAVAGTKIEQALDGAQAATIEIVASIESVDASGSRFSHIGSGIGSRFSLESTRLTEIGIDWRDANPPCRWAIDDMSAMGRFVVHAVFDSANATERDRCRLFIDGELVARTDSATVGASETISQLSDTHYAVGNRENGTRSPQGAILYSALYSDVLSVSEIQAHAARLIASDDR